MQYVTYCLCNSVVTCPALPCYRPRLVLKPKTFTGNARLNIIDYSQIILLGPLHSL